MKRLLYTTPSFLTSALISITAENHFSKDPQKPSTSTGGQREDSQLERGELGTAIIPCDVQITPCSSEVSYQLFSQYSQNTFCFATFLCHSWHTRKQITTCESQSLSISTATFLSLDKAQTFNFFLHGSCHHQQQGTVSKLCKPVSLEHRLQPGVY